MSEVIQRYGLIGKPKPFLDEDRGAPGFSAEVGANVATSWYAQLYNRADARLSNTVDEDYDPWTEIAGYEQFAPSLLHARSKGEMLAMKAGIDSNLDHQDTMARGDWGLIASFAAGIVDPANLIPVPIVRGFGMVKGALMAGTANAAINAGTEAVRYGVDPTMQADEMLYSVGIGALIGGVLGGASGAMGRGAPTLPSISTPSFRRSARAFDMAVTDFASDNAAIPIRASEIDMEVRFGNTKTLDASGRYMPSVVITDSPGFERKLASDNEYHVFDPTLGWIKEADVGAASIRAVDPAIVVELGAPVRTKINALVQDTAALKVQFARGQHNVAVPGVAPFPADFFKDANDYVTYSGHEALARHSLPLQLGVNPVTHEAAIRQLAMKTFASKKESMKLGDTALFPAELLDRGNLSPLAKVARAYPEDNIVGEAALSLGGDFGWAVKANAKGGATPRSLLMAAQGHINNYAGFRAVFDAQFNKFVSGKADGAGKTVLGLNVTASANRWSQWAKSKKTPTITYDIFDEMVARAVFTKGNFKVGSFDVVPEARVAAKELSRIMADYDQMSREYGIRPDQRSAERMASKEAEAIVRNERRLAAWLWGTTGQPSALSPAIEVTVPSTGQVINFQAGTHEDAIRDMIDQLGDEGHIIAGNLTPASYGYVQPNANFITQSDLIAARVNSLTLAQRAVADSIQRDIDTAILNRADYLKLAEDLKAGSPKFTDVGGEREPYFRREWDRMAAGQNRDKMVYVIQQWYERSNPLGAQQRAADTVDNIIAGPGGGGGSRSNSASFLHSRELDIPNSFVAVHGQWGEIAVADFIDTSALRVTHSYVQRAGTMIEAARMFGDKDLYWRTQLLREHIHDTHVLNAADPVAAIARMDAAMGEWDILRRQVLGILHTADPMRPDNRIARSAKNWTALATMGKAILSATAEVMRPMMANGFAVGYKSLLSTYLSDLENVRSLGVFSDLTGELADMARDATNARFSELQMGVQPGGTWLERKLAELMPGFFKLNLLTPWTTFAKKWVANATSHTVMEQAIGVADAIKAGTPPDARAVNKLAALGIDLRAAIDLAAQPFEINPGGKLIIPMVDDWIGPDGKRARNLLLAAIHGEMRRVIVTPSVGDRSSVFSGVWSSKGIVKLESDALTLPLQFLSYGVSAHSKVLVSALQGRDQEAISGMLLMLMLGILGTYLKTPENAWRNKSYGDIVLDGYEAAGIGGVWFGDVNNMVERLSGDQLGIRPALGMDPKFGETASVADRIDLVGPALSTTFDLTRAFWDPELSGTERVQTVRRAIPYNNLIYWAGITRNMATTVGETVEGQ